jgi:hypothetical protein
MAFITPLVRRAASSAVVVGLASVASGGFATASSPPDDLAFLDTETIDAAVAAAENGSADCAALNAFMGIGFLAGFAAMAEDDDAPTPEQIFATSAPLLVPLLDRASAPTDPTTADVMAMVRDELAGAIGELREIGLTDDDLLLLQSSMGGELASSDGDDTAPASTDAIPEEVQQRLELILGHDFESITFLDEQDMPTATTPDGDSVLPWADGCPETASMFDFDMEPVDVSVTFDATVTATADTTG